MKSFELIPFHSEENLKLQFSAEIHTEGLLVHFILDDLNGHLEPEIILPANSANHQKNRIGQFTPKLYEGTCFEIFLGSNDNHYQEWNFSLAGQWWCCDFKDYRVIEKGRPDLSTFCFEIYSQEISSGIRRVLKVGLPLQKKYLTLSASVVLKNKKAQLSYWALQHPLSDKPDFHLKENRVVQLNELIV